MNEWMKSRGWEDNRHALLEYIFNVWTVSSDVSAQEMTFNGVVYRGTVTCTLTWPVTCFVPANSGDNRKYGGLAENC